MRAVVYDRYGGPAQLRLADPAPPAPQPGQVLVRVEAVGLNAYDWRVLRGAPFLVRLQQGLFRPKNPILGSDIAGVVERVDDQSGFRPGQRVFGCLEGCGTAGLAVGGLAELVAAQPSGLAPMPDGLSFEQAASLPMAGGTALIAVRDIAQVQPGMAVLVHGAAGGVGSFAVQIAKALGGQVTGVCRTRHVDFVASLGVDEVIDSTREDFTAPGRTWDAVIDVAANRPIGQLREVVNPGGVVASVGFSSLRHLVGVSLAALGQKDSRRVVMVAADNTDNRYLHTLSDLVTTGQLRPVIDHVYSLDQTAQAFQHIEYGHPAGKIIVLLDE
ncbi:MAG: NAD(P)-dependent alcohol dehydrogenase [Propionibacteriaceae bacterium]|jgi:NADPH:quinone reductase-like Zn-dependent oxidoreductase|nr:NAD(P)-dependent alcohol dehydrogenase [Propionibacteriaceae bacterium]